MAGLGRSAVHTASGALPRVFRALASESLLVRGGQACARPLLWPLLACVVESAAAFRCGAEPSAPRAKPLRPRPPPAPVPMAGRDVTRFPPEVWEHILALRPRDRDMVSPAALAFRRGFGMTLDLDMVKSLRRAGLDVDRAGRSCELRRLCPGCLRQPVLRIWSFDTGTSSGFPGGNDCTDQYEVTFV